MRTQGSPGLNFICGEAAGSVALAGALLEPLDVEDFNFSSPVFDRSGLLDRATLTGAQDPEHLGQKLLGEQERVTARKVSCLRRPTA